MGCLSVMQARSRSPDDLMKPMTRNHFFMLSRPQAPRQTRRQQRKIIIYESDGEWTDEDGWRSD